MDHPPAPIPGYALYGEAVGAGMDEFLHCETIEARSRLYHWEIAPHRHPALSQVLFLAAGEAGIHLQGVDRRAPAPLIVIAPAGSVHGFRFSEGAVGFVVTLTRDFLARFRAADPLAARMAGAAICPLDRPAKRRLLVLGRQLLDAIGDGTRTDGPALQCALAEAWLRTALGPSEAAATGAQPERLARFEALVERHFRDHLPLAHYARELDCTERTLARLTQEAFALTPGQFVNRRIALEARRLLRFTNAGCAAVAGELGFDDPSYFSRFYLRMTGRRPSEEKR